MEFALAETCFATSSQSWPLSLVLFRVDSKKKNRLNLRSTLVLAFPWFKFCRSTLESCFSVDFR